MVFDRKVGLRRVGGGLVLKVPVRLPCENVENLVAGPGEDKFADHPQPSSDLPLPSKTKAVVVTGIKKNSEFGPRLRRG